MFSWEGRRQEGVGIGKGQMGRCGQRDKGRWGWPGGRGLGFRRTIVSCVFLGTVVGAGFVVGKMSAARDNRGSNGDGLVGVVGKRRGGEEREYEGRA